MSPHGEVRLLVLDVPRESIAEVERSLTALGRQQGVDVLGAVGLEAAGSLLTTFDLRTNREAPSIDASLWSILDASGSDGGRTSTPSADDPDFSGSTLFGFENRAVTLRDELLDIARGLSRSRVAVLLLVRPRWRVVLAQALDATESDVVLERAIDGYVANGDARAEDLAALDGGRGG